MAAASPSSPPPDAAQAHAQAGTSATAILLTTRQLMFHRPHFFFN